MINSLLEHNEKYQLLSYLYTLSKRLIASSSFGSLTNWWRSVMTEEGSYYCTPYSIILHIAFVYSFLLALTSFPSKNVRLSSS